MKIIPLSPKKSINKALLKIRPLRSDINLFNINLIKLLSKIDEIEREENQKNHIRDFLRDTFYKNTNELNTKDNKDLVIHLGKTNKENVGVIVESKRPGNKSEMISTDKPNAKALHEIILYYLDEWIIQNNNELKTLIITNVYEWFIFDANIFDKYVYRNTKIIKLFNTYTNDKKDTSFFYEEIAKIISQIDTNISCTYFDIREYEKVLKNEDTVDDKNLIALFKIFSPYHLLKKPFADDSNKLDERFYKELLHIIGLEEAKENGKNIIRRKSVNRDAGSLMENIINILETEDVYRNISDLNRFGEQKPDQQFNIALELSITWINRILFLKLLEGQMFNYHKGDMKYRFLNFETINDYDELYKLFHHVLARTNAERLETIKTKYSHVPYLNSSLFEISELEQQTIRINSLDNSAVLGLIKSSILSKTVKTNKLPSLEYLFKFLDSYDFSSEGTEDIQEDSKTLVNASVLGKVFEKINGYKDGSIFTPGFITMYMCRQAIRPAIVQKFNETYNWNVEKFEDLKNYLADRKSSKDIIEFNNVVNSMRICDPAVGSGHFLVSALNELIVAKSELGIFADETGIRITDYEIVIENDELIIPDIKGDLFSYSFNTDDTTFKQSVNKEEQRLQRTLFHEKQNIIENCLFGVDINYNSVKICRLRLWIELLKNAYYKQESRYTELETLPNIDINIKCGNSLLYRYPLDSDLSVALKTIKYSVEQYRGYVNSYKQEKNRDSKHKIEEIISIIKNDFRTEIDKKDPKLLRFYKFNNEYNLLSKQTQMFEETKKQIKERTNKLAKLQKDITVLQKELDEIKTNAVYKNAFEWRIEFPEVLDNDGNFIGFDAVIGNPPYIRQEEIKEFKPMLQEKYEVFNSSSDFLTYFFELAHNILKSNGELSFIVSNKFFKASYGKQLKNFLLDRTKINRIIEFDKVNVFAEATVKSAIIDLTKIQKKAEFRYVDVKDSNIFDLNTELSKSGIVLNQNNLTCEQWSFEDSDNSGIANKISSIGTALKDWNLAIYRGVLTGYNEAFLIDEKTKDELVAKNSSNKNVIKPLFRGREIQKYYAEFQNSYIIYIPWHFPLHEDLSIKGVSKDAENKFKKEYSVIYDYLTQFKVGLSDRNKAETGIRYEWYAMQRFGSHYWKEFAKPKIIWKRIGSILRFCYDETGAYSLDSTCIATGDHLKYLVALLNSKLINKKLNRYAPKTGTGDLIISVQALEPLKIPIPTEEQEKPFIALVDQIIEAKKQNCNISTLESQIDTLVYKLYNLTPEEISIIEN